MFRLAVIEYHQSKFSSLRKLDVVEAANGEEAWKHLQEGTFDLAIVDYYMPVMNGGELVRKIRNDESHRSLTIIVVSVGGEDVQREVYSAGADLFLKKPVLLKQLLESLESLLGLKREGYDQD